MDNATQSRMDALKNSGARPVLLTYLQALLAERQAGLMHCTLQTFEAHKGRCQELQSLITYLESK